MPSGLLRVALTGGIATGKSYCLARFAEAGAPTIDADSLAREAIAPGSPGFAAVRERFGADVLTPDGAIDRGQLGRRVFADLEARRALEAVIHPEVYAGIRHWFAQLAAGGRRGPAIADIPLLFETGHEGDFDVVVATVCPPERQLERIRQRDGLTAEEATGRLASQWPAGDKARRADHVIDTSGSFAETDQQVRQVWARLSEAASRRPSAYS